MPQHHKAYAPPCAFASEDLRKYHVAFGGSVGVNIPVRLWLPTNVGLSTHFFTHAHLLPTPPIYIYMGITKG